MERPDELRALARFAAAELGVGAGGIGGIHAAIAARVFRALGPSAAPVRATHDAIAGGAYAAVRGHRACSPAPPRTARSPGATPPTAAALRHPRGAVALAVLSGLHGDGLEAERSALPSRCTSGARARGRARLRPRHGPRLVVLVHGLMETEHAWRLGGRPTYGARLARDLGVTPLYVRYNSGRHISENGRALAELLDAVAAWPVPVEEIALDRALDGRARRAQRLPPGRGGRRCLGGPRAPRRHARHAAPRRAARPGRPLRRPRAPRAARDAARSPASCAAAARASATCATARSSTRLGGPRPRRAARRRVRRGAAARGRDALLRHRASSRATRGHRVGRLVGDALVLEPSASVAAGRVRGDGLHVGGAHHLALLNHPAVYAQLREWLGDQAATSRRSSAPRRPRPARPARRAGRGRRRRRRRCARRAASPPSRPDTA